MRNTTIQFFFILVFSCINIKCKKTNTPDPDNPYGLPNATQTGANTFACRINNTLWISRTGIYYMGAEINNDSLGITGSPKFENYFADLILEIKGDLQENKVYNLNSTTNLSTYISNSNCFGVSSNAISTKGVNGVIKLTRLDKSNKIVSGLFNFSIPIPNCDTLKVTDGRFDIKYY